MRHDDESASLPAEGRFNPAIISRADNSVAGPAVTREQRTL